MLENLRNMEDKLSLFTEQALVTALENFVKKNESHAIQGQGLHRLCRRQRLFPPDAVSHCVRFRCWSRLSSEFVVGSIDDTRKQLKKSKAVSSSDIVQFVRAQVEDPSGRVSAWIVASQTQGLALLSVPV